MLVVGFVQCLLGSYSVSDGIVKASVSLRFGNINIFVAVGQV